MTQGFTGQESDSGTAQLDFDNTRQLAAVLGAFVQPDPYNAADILHPQSCNGYGYALRNPLVYSDPGGMGPILSPIQAPCPKGSFYVTGFGYAPLDPTTEYGTGGVRGFGGASLQQPYSGTDPLFNTTTYGERICFDL